MQNLELAEKVIELNRLEEEKKETNAGFNEDIKRLKSHALLALEEQRRDFGTEISKRIEELKDDDIREVEKEKKEFGAKINAEIKALKEAIKAGAKIIKARSL